MHIIGFSLGAHVSGFAGAELPGLSRITGLDPAGPLFESQHPKARLDSTDANFIDVIHSNGENLILGGLGMLNGTHKIATTALYFSQFLPLL